MAKNAQSGALHIAFDASGTVLSVHGFIVVSTTDDSNLRKTYTKALTLTAQQRTNIENYISGKLSELKTDEGIS